MGSERHGQTTSTLDEGPLWERSVSETGEFRQARHCIETTEAAEQAGVLGQCTGAKV